MMAIISVIFMIAIGWFLLRYQMKDKNVLDVLPFDRGTSSMFIMCNLTILLAIINNPLFKQF